MRPVSQSDMLPFERCPALWHATRIRDLDSGNRYTRIGHACHAAGDALTRAALGEDGREPYLVARDAVTAHAERVNLPPDEMHEALDVMDSATAAGSAISFYVPEGWTADVEVELCLDAEFRAWTENSNDPADVSGLTYRGRLDRLQWNEATGELEVWDWKTSHDWMSSEEVRLDVQARFYSMLALAWFPAAHVVKFKRVMLRLGYVAETKFVRGERWHGQIMDRARRLFNATNAVLSKLSPPGTFVLSGAWGEPGTLAQRQWAPDERFGGWCGHCPIRWRCATWEEARTVGRVKEVQPSREEQARKLRALKAAVSELDESLRDDVSANGPIPLGDGTALGFFPKRALVLRAPREETIGELRSMGMGDAVERECFSESERATPGCVKEALAKIEKSRGMRQAAEDRLLAAATGFNFEVKEVDQE